MAGGTAAATPPRSTRTTDPTSQRSCISAARREEDDAAECARESYNTIARRARDSRSKKHFSFLTKSGSSREKRVRLLFLGS